MSVTPPGSTPPSGTPGGPGWYGEAPSPERRYEPTHEPRKGTVRNYGLFAFVFSLMPVCGALWIASVVLGIMALVKTRDTKENHGWRFAISALVIDTVVLIAFAGFVTYMLTHQTERNQAGNVTEAGSADVRSLRAGDCFTAGALASFQDSTIGASLDLVPCSVPHEGEVYSVEKLAGADFPGEEAVTKRAQQLCLEIAGNLTSGPGVDLEQVELSFLYPPSEEAWDENQVAQCLAVIDGGVTSGPVLVPAR